MDFSSMNIMELDAIINAAKKEKQRKEDEVYNKKKEYDWAMVVKAIKNYCENHGYIELKDNSAEGLVEDFGIRLSCCDFDRVGIIDWETHEYDEYDEDEEDY